MEFLLFWFLSNSIWPVTLTNTTAELYPLQLGFDYIHFSMAHSVTHFEPLRRHVQLLMEALQMQVTLPPLKANRQHHQVLTISRGKCLCVHVFIVPWYLLGFASLVNVVVWSSRWLKVTRFSQNRTCVVRRMNSIQVEQVTTCTTQPLFEAQFLIWNHSINDRVLWCYTS